MIENKRCEICGETDQSNFYKSNKSICKSCSNKKSKKRYQRIKEGLDPKNTDPNLAAQLLEVKRENEMLKELLIKQWK